MDFKAMYAALFLDAYASLVPVLSLTQSLSHSVTQSVTLMGLTLKYQTSRYPDMQIFRYQ